MGWRCINRRPEPELDEVKKVYQQIDTSALDTAAGRVRVRNEHDFRDLDFVEVAWQVEHDGRVVDEGRRPAPALGPKQEGELVLPLKRIAPRRGAAAFLNVRYVLAKDEIWAKAGHVVAWEQLPLPPGPEAPRVAVAGMPAVELDETSAAFTVKGPGFSVAVGRASGALESFRPGGTRARRLAARPELLATGATSSTRDWTPRRSGTCGCSRWMETAPLVPT